MTKEAPLESEEGIHLAVIYNNSRLQLHVSVLPISLDSAKQCHAMILSCAREVGSTETWKSAKRI